MIPSKLTSPSAPAFKSGKSTQFLEEHIRGLFRAQGLD